MTADLPAHLIVHAYVLFLGAYCALLGFRVIKPSRPAQPSPTPRPERWLPLLRVVGCVLVAHAGYSGITGWP